LKIQRDNMRRRGIDDDPIRRELHCMELEIRARLGWLATGGAR
jgi:hypothetical protein